MGEAPEYRDIECPDGEVCEWACDIHQPTPDERLLLAIFGLRSGETYGQAIESMRADDTAQAEESQ